MTISSCDLILQLLLGAIVGGSIGSFMAVGAIKIERIFYERKLKKLRDVFL